MTKISPGFYADETGAMHVWPEEALAAAGLPVTPAACEQFERMVLKMIGEEGVEVIIIKD